MWWWLQLLHQGSSASHLSGLLLAKAVKRTAFDKQNATIDANDFSTREALS